MPNYVYPQEIFLFVDKCVTYAQSYPQLKKNIHIKKANRLIFNFLTKILKKNEKRCFFIFVFLKYC